MRNHHAVPAIALCAFAIAPFAAAEWSNDPAVNLLISDVPGPNAQPKIVPTADGGCYISWFGGVGYDVRLQRLDAAGNVQWGANGILIADRSFSSTQDYDLAIDGSGNALLAFRDDRFGGVRVTAQKVAPNGDTPWGANGVQFDDGVAFIGNPKITAGAKDSVYVGWSHDSQTRLERLEADGTLSWNQPTILPNPEATQVMSDLNASEDGTVIVSSVAYATFLGAKHLYAQKVDATGAPVWADWTAVLSSGSLQFGNFPPFVSDGNGGAVFAWYTVSPLQCWVQRLDATGAALFAANGIAVSTDGANQRVDPSMDYDPGTQDIYVCWRELRNNQSENGLYAQRFDSTGARQWGNVGLEITPIGSQQLFSVTTSANGGGDGASFFFIEELAFNMDDVRGARVDVNGATVWAPPIVDASTSANGKMRLRVARSTNGSSLLTWSDSDGGVEHIYAQNVNADGSLGTTATPCPADLNGDSAVDGADLGILLGAWGTPDADLNGDGTTDGADLGILLGDWGPCPR